MRKVATHREAFPVCFPGGAGRARIGIAKGQSTMDVVADRLNPPPAGRNIAENSTTRDLIDDRFRNSGCREGIQGHPREDHRPEAAPLPASAGPEGRYRVSPKPRKSRAVPAARQYGCRYCP